MEKIQNKAETKLSLKLFLKQLLICTGVWNCYFIMGLSMGTPTVLLPQLRASNVTISEETASWLPVSLVYSGIPWIIILSTLTTAIGRKNTFIVMNVSLLIGNSVMYCSKTINQIFISQLFLGASLASHLTISVVILTEFTSTRHRGLFLTIKSATFCWGILIANTIGTFFSWNYIALVGVLCSVYNLLSVSLWPESPYWLAARGKFDECSKSLKWLKGSGSESLKEQEYLVKSYENNRFTKQNNVQNKIKYIFSQAFIKPVLLSVLLICSFIFTGKLVCTVYAIDILKKITKDDSTAYIGMLILDSVTVLGMYLGCLLSKFLNRRTMLVGFSSLGVTFLLVLSGYLYLVKLSLVIESNFVSLALLTGYSVAVSCGPMIMSTSIIGELLPLKSKCLHMSVIALLFKLILSTFLKLSSYCFKHLNVHGTFLLFGILSAVFLVIIYFYIPETKNKTLQEIEQSLESAKSQPLRESLQLMPNVER